MNEQQSWDELRQAGTPQHHGLIRRVSPVPPLAIRHLRTGHYAAYRVFGENADYLARVGIASSTDGRQADNTGFLGTSAFVPSGQAGEHANAVALANAGAPVITGTVHLADGFDVMLLPWVESFGQKPRAEHWHAALSAVHAWRPDAKLPVFTNRAKTFARIEKNGGAEADSLRQQYDHQLAQLFMVATRWSPVHGDAHGSNAIMTASGLRLFDLDTLCWAPSVWDLTHLLTRAGSPGNDGFDVDELVQLFGFSPEEVDCAFALRLTASQVAQLSRAAKV